MTLISWQKLAQPTLTESKNQTLEGNSFWSFLGASLKEPEIENVSLIWLIFLETKEANMPAGLLSEL